MKSLLQHELERLGLTEDAPPTAEQWKQLLVAVQQTSEATLSKLVATYDAVLEAAIDGVIVSDESGRVVRYSKRFAELFGLPLSGTLAGDREERLRSFTSLFADPERFIARTCEIYENLDANSCDELELADRRIIERISSPIRVDHQVIGRVWFYRDITMRKEHESALRKLSEERHQFLFEASPLPIWVFDPKTLQFLAVNETMVRLLGYSRDELLAMSLPDVKPAPDLPEIRNHMTRVAPGVVKRVGVKTYIHKDGSRVELDITSHSVMMCGRLVQLAIALDVTEARRLEERLHQAQKLDAIGQLAGGVAHDFNNILAAILSNAECAREELCDEGAAATMLREIEAAAERGASLTRQLLTFSRKNARQPRIIDLNAVVGTIERLLRRVISEDIAMTFSLDRELGAIHADPSQLEQVVMNLILNARDAMPGGGRIVVETHNVEINALTDGIPPGSYVMLSVSDTGCGMDEATRARVFEPFFTTKEVGKGTGLGLATVFGIVQQSDGAVTTWSEPGRGSTFKVYLPRCAGTHVAVESRMQAQPQPCAGRILLVEDDTLLRASLERRLKGWGYAVLAARDPHEAIAVVNAEREPFHLMLTDLVMPEMDGRTLAAHIQPASPGTKVLFMSGYTQHAAVKTLVTGHEQFIAKPFTGDQLARALRHALSP